jgi:hypothetical protein
MDFYDPMTRPLLLKMLVVERSVNNYELQGKKSDGTSFYGALYSRPLTFNNEPCLLCALYDMTDRKRLDLKMPGKNELQVYAAIKARFPNLPVIFYSAYQGVLEGTTGDPPYKPFQYIDKSANIQELLSVVDQTVHYAQTIRQVAQPTTPVKKIRGSRCLSLTP